MKAWEWLDSPDKWCQKYLAADAVGNRIGNLNENAVAHCLLGLLMWIYKDGDEYFEAHHKVYDKLPNNMKNFVHYNDAPERTFEEVRNLLKEVDV